MYRKQKQKHMVWSRLIKATQGSNYLAPPKDFIDSDTMPNTTSGSHVGGYYMPSQLPYYYYRERSGTVVKTPTDLATTTPKDANKLEIDVVPDFDELRWSGQPKQAYWDAQNDAPVLGNLADGMTAPCNYNPMCERTVKGKYKNDADPTVWQTWQTSTGNPKPINDPWQSEMSRYNAEVQHPTGLTFTGRYGNDFKMTKGNFKPVVENKLKYPSTWVPKEVATNQCSTGGGARPLCGKPIVDPGRQCPAAKAFNDAGHDVTYTFAGPVYDKKYTPWYRRDPIYTFNGLGVLNSPYPYEDAMRGAAPMPNQNKWNDMYINNPDVVNTNHPLGKGTCTYEFDGSNLQALGDTRWMSPFTTTDNHVAVGLAMDKTLLEDGMSLTPGSTTVTSLVCDTIVLRGYFLVGTTKKKLMALFTGNEKLSTPVKVTFIKSNRYNYSTWVIKMANESDTKDTLRQLPVTFMGSKVQGAQGLEVQFTVKLGLNDQFKAEMVLNMVRSLESNTGRIEQVSAAILTALDDPPTHVDVPTQTRGATVDMQGTLVVSPVSPRVCISVGTTDPNVKLMQGVLDASFNYSNKGLPIGTNATARTDHGGAFPDPIAYDMLKTYCMAKVPKDLCRSTAAKTDDKPEKGCSRFGAIADVGGNVCTDWLEKAYYTPLFKASGKNAKKGDSLVDDSQAILDPDPENPSYNPKTAGDLKKEYETDIMTKVCSSVANGSDGAECACMAYDPNKWDRFQKLRPTEASKYDGPSKNAIVGFLTGGSGGSTNKYCVKSDCGSKTLGENDFKNASFMTKDRIEFGRRKTNPCSGCNASQIIIMDAKSKLDGNATNTISQSGCGGAPAPAGDKPTTHKPTTHETHETTSGKAPGGINMAVIVGASVGGTIMLIGIIIIAVAIHRHRQG
jgi:hypothetical protein